ncbi:COMMD7 isoform 3 [Pongo abelii]|uniref:COMMD7 isoform 3 n=1 Tax=Pongo abelii TaxID=9601 RepID=A0A2J8VIR6_PONAB|nr:COMMD7 isoform 3 [Pongo abelii]
MGRLHCTEDPVPEAVGGDMQQLNQLGAQAAGANQGSLGGILLLCWMG